jgi:uncharacterized protein (DUF488 family)
MIPPVLTSTLAKAFSTMVNPPHANHPVFTVGHSNHSIEHFLNLLQSHSIEVLVDVRSYPYSNYSPHFDREKLKDTLSQNNFKYLDLGRELGGRPEGDEFYDSKGHVFYDKLAATTEFQSGLSRLEKGAAQFRVAILCSEENPAICHRALLVGTVLSTRGVRVEHIRGDGRVESDEQVFASKNVEHAQSVLFADAKPSSWKSIPSVSRKNRRTSSSNS